jgi:hypothetical protein
MVIFLTDFLFFCYLQVEEEQEEQEEQEEPSFPQELRT